MIELRGITKRFGTNFAIKNLSFSSERNEFVVILGPAGAGKSTTLSLIAGILKANYGEIYFDGRLMNNVPPERRDVSMTFENYSLYSHMSNFDNMAFPLRARKMPEDEIKQLVHKMAELLHINENELKRKPGFLSGGQRQRIALGRCLIRQADVYLLDEPISHLDTRLKIQMRTELKMICSSMNATMLHVTHDYREAMSLADKIIVLNKGILMQIGTPMDVYCRPESEFVAHFVGDPPMSFVDVSLSEIDGKKVFLIEGTDVSIKAMDDLPTDRISDTGKFRIGIRGNCPRLSGAQNEIHNVQGTVYLIESQGHRNLVSVKFGNALVRVVAPVEQEWKVGDNVWMSLHSDFLYVFSDGLAIYHPPEGYVAQGGII